MKHFIFVLFLLYSYSVSAQDYVAEDSTGTKKSTFDLENRLYLGGNITLNFGTFTVLGANPSLGLRVTDNFSVGLGATYMYYRQQGYSAQSFYGGNVFLKQILFDVAFLQTEYHLMNVEAFGSGPDYHAGDRILIPIWYVGGGYRQHLGENTYASIKILFDLIDHQESRFQNPYISGGISIGL